ncbi:MAG: DEAD/DEAH box helicase [Chitinophagaceae bacterium]|nr:DEAD/DEAH box helicase [Chitinophagaceae bacterium]
MTFDQMGLIAPLLKALQQEGYHTPTPIQAQAIPHLLQGRDLLGCAQTGTGKTAAFSLPILQYLHQHPLPAQGRRPIRTLILTPTRELAIQIEESLQAYGRELPLRYTVVFGGVGQQPQVDALKRGVDILVATPGRLLDLMQQGYVHLDKLEVFVLDEADRMLDMGFVHDVKKVIAKLPAKRQSLFFSATMPPDIQALANSILTNPMKVEVTPVSSTADTVQQHVYFVSKADKRPLLQHLLDTHPDMNAVLVFTRTKHGADRVARDLVRNGVKAQAIHGNKSQNARQQALQLFKSGNNRVLVATDIAARGIDIDDLGYVVNYDLPNVPETYVHRIGRTGRAGASGIAYSFCDVEERAYLKDIQKLIGKQVPVVAEHPFTANAHQLPAKSDEQDRQPRGRQQHQPRQQKQAQRQQQPAKPRQAPPAEKREKAPATPPPARAGKPEQKIQQGQGQQKAEQRQAPPRKFRQPSGPLPMPAAKPLPAEKLSEPSKYVPAVTPLFNDDDRW